MLKENELAITDVAGVVLAVVVLETENMLAMKDPSSVKTAVNCG